MTAGADVFVGRHDELALIGAAAADAAGGRPWVVFIEGPAGVGKTRLLRQACAALGPNVTVLSAQADELATDMAMWVLGQWIDVTASGAFAAGQQLLAVVSDLQNRGPVALVIEDLHWADAASRQAVLAAVRRLDNDKVIVLVTSRDEPHDEDGWDRLRFDAQRCRRVVLGALSWREVAELAAGSGVRMDRRAAERLQRHTAGHPLYVRTLLSELSAAELTAPSGGLPAPRSLASATLARLADLPRPALALVGALAVLGDRSPLVTVGRVAGVDGPSEALDDVLATGFVERVAADPQSSVRFAHPLYRAAVYDDLSPSRRRELHLEAALVSERTVALAHRVAAADGADAALAAELDAAAGGAGESVGPAMAAKYLLWASDLSDTQVDGEHRLLQSARVLLAGGQLTAARALQARVEACADTPLRSLVLGLLVWHAGDAAGAERLLLRVDQTDPPDPRLAAQILVQLGTFYTTQSRGQEAVAAAERALERGVLDPGDEPMAWSVRAVGNGQVHGAVRALEMLDEQQRGTVRADNFWGDPEVRWTRGMLEFYAGKAAEAAASMRAVIDLARRGNAGLYLPRAQTMLSRAAFVIGEWDEALVNARTAVGLATDEDQVWLLAQAHGSAAAVLAARGAWDDATRHVEAARRAAAETNTSEAIFVTRMGEAALARARNDPQQVIAALGPLAGMETPGQGVPLFTTLAWWPPLIAALIDAGRLDEAANHVTMLEAAATLRSMNLTMAIAMLRGRLAAARLHHDSAAIAFEAAVAATASNDPLLERAALRHDYGRHLQRAGNRRAAVEQLQIARDLLQAVGAKPYLARIDQDLAAWGTPTAAARIDSPTPLTDREQDVVILVAKGLTNREVASELFVSAKAVEYHLGNVFAKLGITSRRQLRDWTAV